MFSVNITTTSGRLELCSATVWSLINQRLLPDVINIWVSREAYLADEGLVNVPEWVDTLNNIRNIIKVRYTVNTGPYRKLIPALREANDEDILVYADDDVVYSHGWLDKLVSQYQSNNGKYAVASRIRLRKKNIFGKFKSYNLSPICTKSQVLDTGFIITGIGGCVVKKQHFLSEDLLLDDFLDVCPLTDDLWISKLLNRAGTRVKCCPEILPDIQEILHGSSALNALNVARPKGGRILIKIQSLKHKFYGYMGIPLSNNDFSIDKIESFFNSMK